MASDVETALCTALWAGVKSASRTAPRSGNDNVTRLASYTPVSCALTSCISVLTYIHQRTSIHAAAGSLNERQHANPFTPLPINRWTPMMRWGAAYGVALLALGLLDGLWLGLLARDFYRQEMGDVMADTVRKAPALAFYLLYPVGLLALALQPSPADWKSALGRGALVGLVAYATYDLTNLATLKHWSWRLAATDVAWGTFISACAAALAFLVMNKPRWI
jgi:uncharacterized membrane protein